MKTMVLCLLMMISHLALADAKLMKPILESNDVLFTALLGTDQKVVSSSAAKLVAKIIQGKDRKLIATTPDLKKISAKNSKAQNLELYANFMDGFLPLAKEHGLGDDYLVYYCPMVKKYWLQNSKVHKKTQNVYAQEMLECGGKV